MYSRYLARYLFLLGTALLLLGAWFGWQDYWSRQDAVVLQFDEQAVTSLPVGKEMTLQASLVNRKGTPARVLGLTPC